MTVHRTGLSSCRRTALVRPGISADGERLALTAPGSGTVTIGNDVVVSLWGESEL